VSPNKAQLSLTQVTYLGLSISPTHKTITLDHKAEILSFLGLAGYLRAWVPNFSLMKMPLYEASRGPIQELLNLSLPVSGQFRTLLQPCYKLWSSACWTSLTPLFCTFLEGRGLL
jgi:hypothetical protein